MTKLGNSLKLKKNNIVYYFLGFLTIIVKNDRITIQSNSQRDLLERLTDSERKSYDLLFGELDNQGTSNAEELVDLWILSGLFTYDFNNWERTPGNNKTLVYYTGIELGNPSGNTDNIKHIEYYQGVNLVLRQTITYNSNNNVLTISADV